MLAGFDIGGTKVLGLLIDPSTGAVLERGRASSAGEGPELVATIAALAAGLTERSEAVIGAVGLGVAGLAHRSGVVRYSPNLPDLVEYPIADRLQERLGVPVALGNDASVGALAEARYGAGRGVSDFIFVNLGTGIGTGLVVDGRLLTGTNGFAGESGHMTVDADGPEHLTGRRGPWEYFASGNALGRMGREAAAAGRFGAGIERAGSQDAITGVHVAEATAAGDAEAEAILDEFCREVARGAANLVLVLDPQRLVLGGALVEIGEPLRAGVDRWLHALLVGADHRPPVEVRMAELGADANALGAGLLARELIPS
jgi:glucokinase